MQNAETEDSVSEVLPLGNTASATVVAGEESADEGCESVLATCSQSPGKTSDSMADTLEKEKDPSDSARWREVSLAGGAVVPREDRAPTDRQLQASYFPSGCRRAHPPPFSPIPWTSGYCP